MMSAVWLMISSLLYSLQLQNSSFPRPLTQKEEQRYLELAAQGDLDARNILIERNLRLVAHIMKKYYAQTADQEDLISVGTIGLIKGISTFDASKGARLATYAARCVENEILMHFRAMKKTAGDVSLSDSLEYDGEGGSLSLLEVLCQEDEALERVGQHEVLLQLRKAVEALPESRQSEIIRLRYGLGGEKPLTQRETAQRLGISRSYV